jgi:hypothetical protein
MPMKLARVLIFVGAMAAVVVVVLIFGARVFPRLIDSQLIRDKMSSAWAKTTDGSLTIGKITLFWFPRPNVVIENAEISFGDRAQGSIQTATIYPSVVYLLTGRWIARRALLRGAKIRIRLPESWDEPFDLEELEKQIQSALVRITRDLSVSRIDVSDGSVEITIGDKPSVILEDVAGQTAGSGAELRFELRGGSNLCERFKVEGKISPENLAAQVQVGVQRLKVKESLIFLPLQISEYALRGDASLDLTFASLGLRKVKATIGGSIGPLLFAQHNGTGTVEAKRVKGGITYEGGAVHVDVEQLDLESPRLKASGEFKVQPDSLFARISIRDADIAEVSNLALRIVDDNEGVRRIIRSIPAGTIPEMNFQSAGRSFTEMASRKNIVVSGVMHNCRVFIAGPDLELNNVSGSVRISNGMLEADKVRANLGTTKGWSGKLRVGFDGKTAPFHLDILVQTGTAELQSVLLKVVHDEPFRGELLKVRNVSGELSGRLILGETLDAISPIVAVSKADISGTYGSIPFPIAIRGGRFNYDQRIIKLEGAHGSVGRSSFAGLGVTLHHDASRQMEVASSRISLDLQQTDILLRSFEDLRPQFLKLQSAGGQIELQNLTLTGVYDDPAGWTFASTGSVNQVEITHAEFPGRFILSRGRFDANQTRMIFSDASATMSDASLVTSGTFEYSRDGPRQFEASGLATIDAQMTQWLSRHLEVPEEMKLRSPLKVAAERLAWRAGGNVSFRGQATAAAGPQLFLEAVKNPQGLAVQNLTIDDGDRSARVSFQLGTDRFDLSFRGMLTQQTIDKIFLSFPTQDSALSGDIRLSAALQRPLRVSAQGQLDGSNLWLPLGTEKAFLEKFSIEASGESLLIRSADFRWNKSRMAVSGKVAEAKEILRLDLDVTGDQIDWVDLRRFFVSEDQQRQQKEVGAVPFPAVEGTIRLKTNRFAFADFDFTALETTAAISSSGISAKIDQAIACGINVTGRVDVERAEIGIDVQLTARSARFEPTMLCLRNRQNEMTGSYSLTARLATRGDRDHLLRALKGDFELTAQDGEFIRSPGIDATFDYLNATGDFKVAFPDLDRQTFPYRLIAIKGKMDGEILVGDEVVVQSSLFNLSGQGRVDLARKQIDGKGLIAVLKPVDEVIRRIPVVGSIFGGSLVGIPVRVTGSLERPEVTYLSPADLGTEVLNIPMRILGIPMEAMKLFTPSTDAKDKNIGK